MKILKEFVQATLLAALIGAPFAYYFAFVMQP
jgi:hypothetical protein